jgi:hypothetical protein
MRRSYNLEYKLFNGKMTAESEGIWKETAVHLLGNYPGVGLE